MVSLADEANAAAIVDCDLGLELLRVVARSGTLEERELARFSIDELLDRRFGLAST